MTAKNDDEVEADDEVEYNTEIMVCGYCNGQRGTVNGDVYTCVHCGTTTPLT